MIRQVKLLLLASLMVVSMTIVLRATEPVLDFPSGIGFVAQAQLPPQSTVPSGNEGQSESAELIDEAPLLEFVAEHQQPLLKLLRFMKKKQPLQYQQALKELTRVKQRLATLEKRDSESYAIELELWQVRSNLRMLVAEIIVTPKESREKLKEQLHELVEKEIDLDTARLKLDQERVEQRLSNIQSQLAERTENREGTISKAIKNWENRALRSSTRSKKQ